jgi:hypothetical protein
MKAQAGMNAICESHVGKYKLQEETNDSVPQLV